MLWLPLTVSTALAASVSMEAEGSCHDMVLVQSHMAGHQSPVSHHHAVSCSSCGVCHFACSACVAPSSQEFSALQLNSELASPYQITFESATLALLDRPPLARS